MFRNSKALALSRKKIQLTVSKAFIVVFTGKCCFSFSKCKIWNNEFICLMFGWKERLERRGEGNQNVLKFSNF